MEEIRAGRIKQLFIILLIVAFVVSIISYVFFLLQKPVYQSKGRLAVSYQIEPDVNSSVVLHLKSDENLARYFDQVIETEDFLKDLYSTAGISYDNEEIKENTDSLNSTFVAYTNVVNVSITDKDKSRLEKISDKFVSVLSQSKYTNVDSMNVKVDVLDKIRVSEEPVYPEALKYALIIFVSILFVGSLIIYSFS